MGIVSHELRKCFGGMPFLAACAASVAIALGAAAQSYAMTQSFKTVYGDYSNYTAFINWMVPNGNVSVLATVFMFVAPVLAIVPFACSGASEALSGYEAQVALRAPARRRVLAKGLAVFCSGAAVVAAGLVANFLALGCALPMRTPVIEDWFITGIWWDCMFSWFIYNAPAAYVVAFTLFDAVLMGLWAAFVCGLGSVTRNRVILVVVPYAGMLVVQQGSRAVAQALGINGPAVALIDFMQGTFYTVMPEPTVIAAVVCLLTAACACLLLVWAPRREVR